MLFVRITVAPLAPAGALRVTVACDEAPPARVEGVSAIEVTPMIFVVIPADGVSRFALSSTALLRILKVPAGTDVQVYVQLVVPVAGCQVAPPLSETSTPATSPPPASTALPDIVIVEPA